MRQLKITASITSRSDYSLEKYLSDISKEEMINSEEEVRLARKIREGDQAALDRLVRANLRFVVSVSKQYQNQGLPLTDLISEGNVGLIKAAKKFDETRGFKFISYAVWWIRQSILEALAEKARIVRLPLNQVGVLSKINKSITKLEQDLERLPSPDEIAEVLDLSAHKVEESLKSYSKHVSIDAPLTNDSDSGNLVDVMSNDGPDSDYLSIERSLKIEIDRSLDTLSQKEREVLKLFYGIDATNPISLDEIGTKLSISRERVRQIREKSIKKLRANTRSGLLKSYL
jgi:RNA polymerase primary sigma factor